ncbi:MAG TPA: methionine biosynthesis protein MetW [Blastocatellia bacterium]|jgi:SAM-dependent methyltransferase|nr:methionine biosynthesis protein MetW [Blastocatellia bacterium]
MSTSLIYRSSSLYELAMLALYGRHYGSRYRAIAELIPDGSTVLDLCCGPAFLYHRYLRPKSVQYTGLDVNEKFIEQLASRGASARKWDLRSNDDLPKADFVVMQASLYHFLPDPSPVVDRMLRAARKQTIIAEPVRNVSSNNSRFLSFVGKVLTDPGTGNHTQRFTEASLDQFFRRYVASVQQSYLIAGGREKMYVIAGKG